KQNAGEQVEPKWMHMTNAFPGQKFIRQAPRFDNEKRDGREKFRIPIQERIQDIENHVPKRTPVIDCCLSTLGAMAAGQLRPAILAMRQRRTLSIFAAAEKTPARRSLHRRNGGVAKDEFCRLVGHWRSLENHPPHVHAEGVWFLDLRSGTD